MLRLAFITVLISSAFISVQSQPYQFRGAERNGIYPDTGLLDSWPDEGPELLNTISGIGDGFAAPAISEKGIYIAGMQDSLGYMQHYNHQNELIWKVSYGKEYTFKYTGARGTPTIEDGRLYYSGTFGDAICLDVNDGRIIWKKNIFKEFHGEEIKWGYTESPLIYNNMVILTPGGFGQNIVALNKSNGDLIWATDADSTINAYCSPVIINHKNEDYILLNTRDYLLVIHPATGEIAFSHPIFESHTMHATTPLYREGKIFYSSGYGEGSVLFEIDDESKQLDTIYRNGDMDCKLSGLIEVDGIVYGTSDRKKQWVGIRLESGETVFTSRELKPGSFLLADEKFFIFTETGEVALSGPIQNGFSVESRFQIPVEPVHYAFTHPVLYNGVLYIRYRENLWLYNVKGEI